MTNITWFSDFAYQGHVFITRWAVRGRGTFRVIELFGDLPGGQK